MKSGGKRAGELQDDEIGEAGAGGDAGGAEYGVGRELEVGGGLGGGFRDGHEGLLGREGGGGLAEELKVVVKKGCVDAAGGGGEFELGDAWGAFGFVGGDSLAGGIGDEATAEVVEGGVDKEGAAPGDAEAEDGEEAGEGGEKPEDDDVAEGFHVMSTKR